jgi:hypothetical protein
MTDAKQLIAITALNKMMAQGHFNICTIDSVAEMLGVNPKGEAYRMLRPLHCVNFSDMPQELRTLVPALIKQCLAVEPTYQFTLPTQQGDLERTASELPRRGLLRLLARDSK